MALKVGVGLFTGQIPPGSDRTFHQEYRDAIELVKVVEAEGLDSAWVSEHHFAADGYLPSLAVLLAAFAAVTERIELGTGVVLAPFHDPIRMAEDFAVLDQISGGRTLPGFGIAWREEEFRAFNIDTKTRVGRMVELIEILRLAWTGERFDYSGKYFNYEQVAVTPRPFRPPPIFVGGFADEAVRRAGRIGDGYMSSRVPPDRAAQLFELATQGWAEAGKKGGPKIAILQNAFVTDDPERDWPMVRDGVGHQLGTYAGWLDTDVPGVEMKVKPPPEEKLRE
ncbi:MAG: LLM class flavin-dependent oxidoreductase, partial [Actinomycetota bacterium]